MEAAKSPPVQRTTVQTLSNCRQRTASAATVRNDFTENKKSKHFKFCGANFLNQGSAPPPPP